MNRVYESAAETAKKIRATLKAAFPGVKFSVRSSTYSMGSSVNVSWTDGPMGRQVDEVLNRFKSGYFDGMADMYETTGYTWEGLLVVGAKHVSGSRTLSSDRRHKLEQQLELMYPDTGFRGYYQSHWDQAEQQLIDAGALTAHPSKLPEPAAEPETPETPEEMPLDDGPRMSEPPDPVRKATIIPFPVKNSEMKAVLQAEKLLQSLAPEQKLKLQIIQAILGMEVSGRQLLDMPMSIDELFKTLAESIYSSR